MLSEEERKKAAEFKDVVEAIRDVITTRSGRIIIKYFFKTFHVGSLPPEGLKGSILHGELGFRRAGEILFKIASVSNSQIASLLLAEIQKEAYDAQIEELRNGQGN